MGISCHRNGGKGRGTLARSLILRKGQVELQNGRSLNLAADMSRPDVVVVGYLSCSRPEAMQLMPDAIRPALRAAFRRARLAGLMVEAVDWALNGRSATSPAGAEGAATKSDKTTGKKDK
jgi:hypothetical protein